MLFFSVHWLFPNRNDLSALANTTGIRRAGSLPCDPHCKLWMWLRTWKVKDSILRDKEIRKDFMERKSRPSSFLFSGYAPSWEGFFRVARIIRAAIRR